MSKNQLFSVVLIICLVTIGCNAIKDTSVGKASAADIRVEVVKQPDTKQTNSFYVGNRPPLTPSPFIKPVSYTHLTLPTILLV